MKVYVLTVANYHGDWLDEDEILDQGVVFSDFSSAAEHARYLPYGPGDDALLKWIERVHALGGWTRCWNAYLDDQANFEFERLTSSP